MITLLLILGGVTAGVFMAGFFGGYETAAYGASGVRLRALRDAGDERAGTGLRLLKSLAPLITTTLIGHNLSVYMGTFILTRYLEELQMHRAEIVATLTLTPICFVFAETLPKRIAHATPNEYLLAGARSTDLSQRIFRPLGWVLGLIAQLLQDILTRMGYHTESSTGRTRLLEYFEAGFASRVLTRVQHELVQRILTAQEQSVRNVMIPFARAVVVGEHETCRVAAERMVTEDHRRAPLVDRTGAPTGRMVTLNDVLRNPASLDQPVTQIARTIPTVHGNTRLHNALRRMQSERARIALVVGRGDTPVGFITMSDLISTVVGATRL